MFDNVELTLAPYQLCATLVHVLLAEGLKTTQRGCQGFDIRVEIRAAGKCWSRSTSSERDNQLSADNNDALVTDADFAEIEAHANSAILV